MTQHNILIIESSKVFQKLLISHLIDDVSNDVEWTYEVKGSWKEAEPLLREKVFDAVVLNATLKDCNPEQALKNTKSIAPDTAIIITTSDDDRFVETNAVFTGVQDVLFKPEITPLLFRKTLLFAISRQNLQLAAQEREKLLLSRLAKKRSVSSSSSSPAIIEECGKLLSFLGRQFEDGQLNTSKLTLQLSQSILKSRVKVGSFKGINWLSFKIPEKHLDQIPVIIEPSKETAQPKQCLVVEDSLVNQKIVVRILEKMGFEVKVANNGEEAVGILKKEYYPLVLMDIQMPVMDGVEATRHIRNELPEIRQPRIIALTASDLDRYSVVYQEAGMDGSICKPVTSSKLTKELEQVYFKLESKS